MAAVLQYGEALERELGAWQILFITISGTIGLGFATTTGEVLAISGPGGVLIAFGVVGLVAICVMEGVCEMIVLWPISNAMIEFVRAFVDPDLAIVVGITYWYTYAVTLAALIIGSATLLQYWDISFSLMNVTFALFLFTIFIINSRGIRVFGWIELFGGILKLLLVLTIFIIMILINAGAVGKAGHIGSDFFNDGVRNNPNVATTHFKSVLVSIPLAIFSYIGVELLTVTAFEARDPGSLKGPAKHIGYIILAIYLISIGGFIANIEWFNQYLPLFFSQKHVSLDDPSLGHEPRSFPPSPNSSAAPIIAVIQAGIPKLPGVLVGFLVYSGLSAANTALYVASRTLYGLARDLNQMDDRRIVRFFAKLNTISSTRHIPVWGLVVSWVMFACWLPFVHLKSNFTQNELQQTLVAIGSVGCVLVWASQCLAFIRYNKWLSKHRIHLVGPHLGRFQRWPRTGFSSYASSIQPVPAYIGLVSSLLIVFVLNSVSMFNGEQLQFKALTVYLGPSILLVIFVILKCWNRRGPVKLGNWDALRMTLNNLDSLIEANRPPTPPENVDEPNLQNNSTPPLDRWLEPPSPNVHINGYANHVPTGHQNSGYPNEPPLRASPSANRRFAMPPTAAQLTAMLNHNAQPQPHHQTSHPSLHSRAESPLESPFTGGTQNYELGNLITSPVSAASEVHSESMDVSRMSAGGREQHERRVSEISAYISPESRLESSGYEREWRESRLMDI